jgi:hypothetical protein
MGMGKGRDKDKDNTCQASAIGKGVIMPRKSIQCSEW